MTGDREDPGRNYTVPQNQPSGLRIPEFAIRQLIGWAIKQVRSSLDTKPVTLVDELFAMAGTEVVAQIKSWLRDHENIYTDVSWPREDVSLPVIVVEPEGEQEESSAFLGDLAGMTEYGRFGDAPVSDRIHFAVPERHTTNIYIATDNDRLTLFLYTLVKFILLSNKDQLTRWYDIHNLTISGQSLTHDEKLFPTFGYYRMLTLSYLCLFDFSTTEESAKIVSLDLLVDVQSPGLAVSVPIT